MKRKKGGEDESESDEEGLALNGVEGTTAEPALGASDVINADYKISQLMPLRNLPLKRTFPLLCCCLRAHAPDEKAGPKRE